MSPVSEKTACPAPAFCSNTADRQGSPRQRRNAEVPDAAQHAAPAAESKAAKGNSRQMNKRKAQTVASAGGSAADRLRKRRA